MVSQIKGDYFTVYMLFLFNLPRVSACLSTLLTDKIITLYAKLWLNSFVKTFWLLQTWLWIWPFISAGFLSPVSMVHFSGKRSMETVVVNSKHGTQRPLLPGVHVLLSSSTFYQDWSVWPTEHWVSNGVSLVCWVINSIKAFSSVFFKDQLFWGQPTTTSWSILWGGSCGWELSFSAAAYSELPEAVFQ